MVAALNCHSPRGPSPYGCCSSPGNHELKGVGRTHRGGRHLEFQLESGSFLGEQSEYPQPLGSIRRFTGKSAISLDIFRVDEPVHRSAPKDDRTPNKVRHSGSRGKANVRYQTFYSTSLRSKRKLKTIKLYERARGRAWASACHVSSAPESVPCRRQRPGNADRPVSRPTDRWQDWSRRTRSKARDLSRGDRATARMLAAAVDRTIV
jgi:hypothetical protein